MTELKLSAFDVGCRRVAEGFRRNMSRASHQLPYPPALALPLALPSMAKLRREYEHESQRYAARFRSAFLVNFLLGLLAVAIALVPLSGLLDEHALHALGSVLTLAEMACILSILLLHLAGREQQHGGVLAPLARILPFSINQSWRKRWVEYRLYAEQLRYGELFIGFPGEVIAPGHDASHLLDMGINNAFRAWYQENGVACQAQRLDQDYVGRYAAYLSNLIEEQRVYHCNTAARCHAIHHRLHAWASGAFWLTLAGCALHLWWHAPVLSVLTALLPAFAATCHGILSAGEYAKLADVSRQMAVALAALERKVAAGMAQESLNDRAATLRTVLLQLYELTISEARGWHLAMRDKDIQVG
jgi:hypothetical protein